ncbi:hypothetical protein [Streptomyces chrestomyceticus]|uniref:hypothetical protein n=1 Tax=Streptomyces chrestomyceticus TaxID=68185 RepID=UPI0033D1612D
MRIEALLDSRCWHGCAPTTSNRVIFVGPGDFRGLYVPLFLCQHHGQRLQARAAFGSAACSLCETIGVPVDRIGENTSVMTSVRRWPDGRSVVTQWARRDALYGCVPCQTTVITAVFRASRRRGHDRHHHRSSLRPLISAA